MEELANSIPGHVNIQGHSIAERFQAGDAWHQACQEMDRYDIPPSSEVNLTFLPYHYPSWMQARGVGIAEGPDSGLGRLRASKGSPTSARRRRGSIVSTGICCKTWT